MTGDYKTGLSVSETTPPLFLQTGTNTEKLWFHTSGLHKKLTIGKKTKATYHKKKMRYSETVSN